MAAKMAAANSFRMATAPSFRETTNVAQNRPERDVSSTPRQAPPSYDEVTQGWSAQGLPLSRSVGHVDLSGSRGHDNDVMLPPAYDSLVLPGMDDSVYSVLM